MIIDTDEENKLNTGVLVSIKKISSMLVKVPNVMMTLTCEKIGFIANLKHCDNLTTFSNL